MRTVSSLIFDVEALTRGDTAEYGVVPRRGDVSASSSRVAVTRELLRLEILVSTIEKERKNSTRKQGDFWRAGY